MMMDERRIFLSFFVVVDAVLVAELTNDEAMLRMCHVGVRCPPIYKHFLVHNSKAIHCVIFGVYEC